MESDLLLGNSPHDLQREPQPEDCEPMPDLFKPLFSPNLLTRRHTGRRLLAAHSRLAMIDYPFGAV